MNTQAPPTAPPFGPEKRSRGWLWALLALVLIVLAGFGGWWYANDRGNKDKAALQKQIDELKSQAKKASEKTLTIKEWGVTMTLPSELSDMTYSQNTDPAGVGGSGSILLGTQSIAAISQSCAVLAPDISPLGHITKETKQRGASDSPPGSRPTDLVRHVGAFYYYLFEGGPDACDQSHAKEIQDKVDQLLPSLRQAFNTLGEVK